MKHLVILLSAAILAYPAAVPATPVTSVAAVVDNDIITTLEVDREVTALLKEVKKKGEVTEGAKAQLRATALNKLIDKKLVEQKIKELDIRVTDDEIRQQIEDVKKQNNLSQEALVAALASQGMTFESYKAQLREQFERLRLVSQEVRSKVQVSEKEISEFYEANKPKMTSPEQFRARHILFKIPPKATKQEVEKIKSRAESVLKEIRKGGDFTELARKHSDDASAPSGGELGILKRGDILPELDAAVAHLQPGEVSDVITTPAGFDIIKLEERIAGKGRSLEEMKEEIEELLYRKKSEERFNQWLEELRKSAAIEIRQ